jgi:Lar family restriction alleviation protein
MKLKPCPFCGGEAIMGNAYDVYWITCKHCKASSMSFHTSKQAIEAWNRREPIDKIVEQLEEKATEAGEWYNNYEDSYYEGKEDGIRDAIEVVESGGIDVYKD